MKRIATSFALVFISILTSQYSILRPMSDHTHTMLCLGDSYTIGESVTEDQRFPNQCIKLLEKDGIHFSKPQIIARTGWTTDELIHAIDEAKVTGTFDCVTLLIGVNNQYRGYDKDVYRKEFKELLASAVKYAGGNASHVFVVSIPDWGVTPFGANDAKGRSAQAIGKEIDGYNAIDKEEAHNLKVHYTDINPISKKASTDPTLIANDNLHPSGKMYGEWAALLAKEMAGTYK